MSDTPKTDDLHKRLVRISEGPEWIAGKDYCDMTDFARQLERELAEAKAENNVLHRLIEEGEKVLVAENAVLRDAINDALPWMIKLGDYIGNGTQADPMGRCNAITKMRIAVEKRDE